MNKKVLNWLTTLAVVAGLSACGGGGGDSSDSRDDDEYIPPPDVPIDDTPLDEIPEHQEKDLQDHMFETSEFRTPIGNVYEISEQGQLYYVHFNEWRYNETIVQTYAFDPERSCYRAPRGEEPNAALNLAVMEHGEMEQQFSETPSLTFNLDGINTWYSHMRDNYELLVESGSSQYRIEWTRDDYGILDGFNVFRGDEEEPAETFGEELRLNLEGEGMTAVISLNVEPTNIDPVEFKQQRCDDSFYKLYENPTPNVENADDGSIDSFDPYDGHPKYTLFIDERTYKNNDLLPIEFEFEHAPRDNKLFAVGLYYQSVMACYQPTDRRYSFHYGAVQDRYVYASWLDNRDISPLLITFDPSSSDPLTLQTSDAKVSGTSVYVPYDGQSSMSWIYRGVGLSTEPSLSMTLEEILPMICE